MPGRQRIPRPDTAVPGERAPWLRPDAPPVAVTVERVRQAMRAARNDHHLEPATPAELPGAGREAAVLVPLFEDDGEVRVVLTRRSASLRSHTGEVSFPGGRLEPGEEAVAGALREAGEEIGINPETVEILGQLAPLSTMSSRAAITPFVGLLPGRPALTPSPAEVELAFDVALADLAAEGVHREERWSAPGMPERPIHFFELPDDIVWGATARILHELLTLVTRPPG